MFERASSLKKILIGSTRCVKHTASNVILRMAELTLIDAITSNQVITEVERNILDKILRALPAFQCYIQYSPLPTRYPFGDGFETRRHRLTGPLLAVSIV